MRTRTRSSQLGYPDAFMSYKWTPGSQGQASLMNVTDRYESMTDRKTPEYFKALKKGDVLPVSPMTKVAQDVILQPGHATYKAVKLSSPALTFEANAQNVMFCPHENARFNDLFVPKPVINKAYHLQEALAIAQTDAWDTLTFAAEFHKTVQMLKTAKDRYSAHWERVYAVVSRTRKGKLQTSQQDMFSLFSEVWLEYRFGLRPLIFDIEAISESIQRLVNGLPTLARGHSDETKVAQRTATSAASQLNAFRFHSGKTSHLMGVVPYGGQTRYTFIRKVEVYGRASVGVEVTTRGLTADDGIVTAWELMPWSVFIDYFINIGSLLRAFSPFASGVFAYATYSETVTDSRISMGEWVAKPSAGWFEEVLNQTPSIVTQTSTTYQRTIESVSPTLDLRFDLNLSQIIDLLTVFGLMRVGQLKKLKRLSFRR